MGSPRAHEGARERRPEAGEEQGGCVEAVLGPLGEAGGGMRLLTTEAPSPKEGPEGIASWSCWSLPRQPGQSADRKEMRNT